MPHSTCPWTVTLLCATPVFDLNNIFPSAEIFVIISALWIRQKVDLGGAMPDKGVPVPYCPKLIGTVLLTRPSIINLPWVSSLYTTILLDSADHTCFQPSTKIWVELVFAE